MITDLGAGGGIEHGRGIPHTAAHDVLSNKATQEISPIMGPSGLRARVGLRPTRPQHDAGNEPLVGWSRRRLLGQ
jgi:hypothetical protein